MQQQSPPDQGASPADLDRPAADAAWLGDLIADLHRSHGLALVRLAKLLVGDLPSAEDVVQDVFLALYRTLPGLRDPQAILPYLRVSVINRSRSTLRSRRRAALRPVQHEPDLDSPESAVIDRADRLAVLAAVRRLPARSREVLVLRYYLDLTDREIAADLGISPGTVRSTASRAIAALAAELKEEL